MLLGKQKAISSEGQEDSITSRDKTFNEIMSKTDLYGQTHANRNEDRGLPKHIAAHASQVDHHQRTSDLKMQERCSGLFGKFRKLMTTNHHRQKAFNFHAQTRFESESREGLVGWQRHP